LAISLPPSDTTVQYTGFELYGTSFRVVDADHADLLLEVRAEGRVGHLEQG
jgi:hypothetical protein